MYPPQGIIEIDGHLYEWRWNDCICGLYEIEPEDEFTHEELEYLLVNAKEAL